ncbi:hypothetical protein [Alkaliphilus crotonatoxidans]
MRVIPFRQYKHWSEERILEEIENTLKRNRENHQHQYLDNLNQLFREAKLRGLALQQEEMWRKILYYIDE